ncbi:H+/oligopeptide symporter [Handroanthus impetiginosus]|uniref:H+/oligopeptide symporter n=1 Tax=Handroanthus impetiginosus TaxID=429701 RepID=A0A2G9G288_9LAMI|nr:H+/oligopeptide symporter [Handroanthus impetiginosus]
MEVRDKTMFISDAVDYKGAPANRSTTGAVELCERLSTMAIGVNLVTYLQGTLHTPSATSSTIVTNWGGISFLLSLFGGILADSFLGRYWTITIFANVHMLGSCLLAISTVVPNLRPPRCDPSLLNNCIEANGLQMAVFYIALYTIAVGIGGIKCSVSGFGTDQFDQKDDNEKAQMAYFFNRFYFFISIGTLLAVTVFIYIQDKVARVWGYGSCTIMMLLATAIFLSGKRRYRYKECLGSPIVQILQVLVAAIRKRKLKIPSNMQQLYETHSDESRIARTRQYSFLDKAAIVENEDDLMIESGSSKPWRLCSVTKVEEVKMMIRILPIWATTIMYYVVHAQMITFAVLQASSMRRSIGSFEVPAGSFNAFFIGAILLALGIYDRVIIPLWKKKKGTLGLTNLQKITLGLAISISSMVVAAVVETKRLKVAKSMSTTVSILPVSAFLLVPQFVLAGAAEGFVYSGQLDFFLTESPKGMKAVSTSLFLTTIAFGFFLSTAIVSIIRKVTQGSHDWLPANINHGRLDLFYGFIALLSCINLGLYLCSAKWFLRKKMQILNS